VRIGLFSTSFPKCRIAYAQGCRIDMARCSLETANYLFPFFFEPLDWPGRKTTRLMPTLLQLDTVSKIALSCVSSKSREVVWRKVSATLPKGVLACFL
jgi:hypothetical protein